MSARGFGGRGLLLAAGVALGACGGPAPPRAEDEAITVFAAASLAEAFAEIGAALGARDVAVRFNFAGSQHLASQIEHGARADVFASADERWMAHVADRGLVATPVVFARNRLCVVVPRANPARIDRLEDLSRRGVKLVIAADAVPAGRYAREALRKLAGAPGFPPEFARRALANVVSEEENVRAIVAKVQLAEADAGIVYRSDVTPAIARRVRVLGIPEAYDVEAAYPIAVVAGARRAAEARAFVDHVRSPEGQRTLVRHGFRPAGGASP